MKKSLILVLGLFVSINGYAQGVSRSLIGSAGVSQTSSSTTLSWSLGELMISSYEPSVGLFEGFHTPEQETTTSIYNEREDQSLYLFPNPNKGKFQLKLENIKSPCLYTIYNIQTEVIQEGLLWEELTDFDLPPLNSGFYYMTLSTQEKQYTIPFIIL